MPKAEDFDNDLIADFETAKQVVANVRNIRQAKNIANKATLELDIVSSDAKLLECVICKIANVSIVKTSEKPSAAATFIVNTTEFAVPIKDNIDVESEIKKMEDEIKYLQGFLASVEKKLSNERFVANAKPEIVENERKKKSDAESKINMLNESIAALKK